MRTLNNGISFSNFFECTAEGYWKEVYLFEDYVIKFGSNINLEDEERRKKLYNGKDIFVPLCIIPLNTRIKASEKLHQPWLTHLIFQKRIKFLVQDTDKQVKLIVDQDWFYTFLKQNYTKEQQDLILSVVDGFDCNSHNIGYDANGKAVAFDW